MVGWMDDTCLTPEPASLSFVGLIVPALVRRRRK